MDIIWLEKDLRGLTKNLSCFLSLICQFQITIIIIFEEENSAGVLCLF